MSILTESLAKGLANRFISEHSKRATATKSRELALQQRVPSSGFGKQATWEAFARTLSEIHRESQLSEVEYGSKRKKITVLHYIGAPLANPSVEWEEDAIPVDYLVSVSPHGILPQEWHTRCFVGKHALARVFQRLGVSDTEANTADLYAAAKACAIEEFSMLACWSVIYLLLWASNEELQASSSLLTAVIPSKHGMFFADMSSARPLLNVRTYIHDRQMTEGQANLKQALLTAVSREEAKMIECPPGLIWESGAGLSVAHARLKKLFEVWAPSLLKKVEDRKQREQLTFLFKEALSSTALNPAVMPLYEKAGLASIGAAMRTANPAQAIAILCNKHGIVDDGAECLGGVSP